MDALLERPKTGYVKARIFRKISDIPQKDWTSVYPEVLENYGFFKTLDESGFEPFSFYYILVYQDEEVVGATPCFLMKYPLETTVRGPLQKLVLAIKKIFPHAFTLKALICGLPMDQGRIGIRSEKPQDILDVILSCMEGIAQETGAGILAFKDFGCEYEPLLDTLQTDGFYKAHDLPSTAMKISFSDFNGYLKTLSRASRDGLKRKLKKIDQGPVFDMEVTNRLSPGVLDEVYALYLQTVVQSEDQFEVAPKEFFARVAENMPEETRFFLWRKDSRLVGFAYCLVSEDHFIDFYLGFDYAIAHDVHLYFVRFRDLMNWCLEHGIKTYEMGPTGYEAKRRLGFEMVPLFIYAKHRNPLINPLFKLMCRFLDPVNHHEMLRNMKKGKESCLPKD